VASDETGIEPEEVPLCPCCLKHLVCADAHPVEDDGELVHEGDVDVALGVFDDLGCLGNLYRGGPVHPCLDDHLIGFCNVLCRHGVTAAGDLDDLCQRVVPVSGVDALGREAHLELFRIFQSGKSLEHRYALFLCAARVDG